MLRILAILALGTALAGCMQTVAEPVVETNFSARDKELLAKAPYAKAMLAEPYRRHIVDYHRKEAPGSIVVDSDARYLYYVLPDGKDGKPKAIRYGIAVGEEALAFSGIAKVGRMAEWPSWTPTQNIKNRLEGIPNFVGPGPHNPLGARGALSLCQRQGHAVPHPRHQPAGNDRLGGLLGLHPHDQRGHHRPV